MPETVLWARLTASLSFLEAEALGADENGHDQPLRAGEVAAGELGLEALTHAALDDVELAFGLLRELAKFSGRVIVFEPRVVAVARRTGFLLDLWNRRLHSFEHGRNKTGRETGA